MTMTDERSAKLEKPRKLRSPAFWVQIETQGIEQSKMRDSGHCMIATAVQEARPDARSISVDLQTIRFSLPELGLRYTYLTPRKAQIALIDFDQGVTPEPFSFKLSGGMVTLMKRLRKSNVPPQPRSTKQQAVTAAIAGWPHLTPGAKPKLIPAETENSIPIRVGGATPPTTPFARRRAFGIRSLKR